MRHRKPPRREASPSRRVRILHAASLSFAGLGLARVGAAEVAPPIERADPIEVPHERVNGIVAAHPMRLEVDRRAERRLVLSRDAGEADDLARSRLPVEAL